MEDFSRLGEISKRKQHRDTKTRFKKQMKKLVTLAEDFITDQEKIDLLKTFVKNNVNYFKLKTMEKRYFAHAFNWYQNNRSHYNTQQYKDNFNKYSTDNSLVSNLFLFIKYIEFIHQNSKK